MADRDEGSDEGKDRLTLPSIGDDVLVKRFVARDDPG
jgi:hypothetical protein